jgi:hypothetical protein
MFVYMILEKILFWEIHVELKHAGKMRANLDGVLKAKMMKIHLF